MKQEEIFTNKYLVPLMAGISSLIWGSASPALKVSFKILTMSNDDLFLKMLFASYRFFIASLLLFSIQIIKDGFSSIKIKKRNISSLIILGLLQTTLQYFFFYNGLANTSGVKAPILSTSSIFFIVIASHFIYKDDKLNLQKIFGLILGLIIFF